MRCACSFGLDGEHVVLVFGHPTGTASHPYEAPVQIAGVTALGIDTKTRIELGLTKAETDDELAFGRGSETPTSTCREAAEAEPVTANGRAEDNGFDDTFDAVDA